MKGTKFSFKKLFGSKQSDSLPGSSAKANTKNKNTLDRLREMEDMLQKKQAHLESKIEEQLVQAKKFGKTNKRAALMALKRKKRLEEELTRIDGTLTTIELQREALEAAKNNLQVLGAMKDAANVLKNAQKYITTDKVFDIMDEVNEQQEISQQIADAIANPVGTRMDASFDDAELEKELEDLEQEELNKTLLDVDGIEIPEVTSRIPDKHDHIDSPTPGTSTQNEKKAESKSAVVVDPDEKELEELAQWSA